MTDWSGHEFVRDIDERSMSTIPALHLTGWETVVFQLADEGQFVVALSELRAAIADAERLVGEWKL